jgi:peptidoglycan/LPS O-acetylase OafA/YrhL
VTALTPGSRVPRLAALAHGRDNNFQLLRLAAAAFVVLFHSYALTDRWTREPLWRLIPEQNFGALGVKIFFVVSGFLVTQSWLARRRPGAFVAARALRIYPALVAATLFTIVLAGWSSALPWREFLAHPQTLDYAWRVALGWEMVYRLPGAFATNPFPHEVNGSLWTLPIELRLYLAVLAAGLVGFLARRGAWLVAMLAMVAGCAVYPDAFPLRPNDRVVRELALLFGLGSLAWVWLARCCSPLSSPTSCSCWLTIRACSGAGSPAWATTRMASTCIRFPYSRR